MKVLTLLRSNLRHRKGPFISTALLVMIITAMTISMLSVKKNYINGRDHAHEYTNSPAVMAFAKDSSDTDKIIALLDNCPSLDHYEITPAVSPEKAYIWNDEITRELFLTALPEKVLLLSEDKNSFAESVPELKKGEIYVPYSFCSFMDISEGDRITAEAADRKYSFTVRGFIVEPFIGSDMIGIKQLYISSDDLAEISENSRRHDLAIENSAVRREQTGNISAAENDQEQNTSTENDSFLLTPNNGYINIRLIKLYCSDDNMSDSSFMREIELETKLISSSLTITKADSMRYTGLEMNMMYSVVLAFTSILFLIVLIVIAHSIRVEIKIDYVNMGILKSQGITERTISFVITLRYLIAETVGMIIGLICSIPIERKMSSMFKDMTGILPEHSVAWGVGSLVLMIMISASALLIFLCTRDLSRISPVKAINGGRDDFHYDSLINAPITKRGLSLSLSLRGITSAKKRYIGLTFITAILTFFMIAVNTVNSTLTSRSVIESTGNIAPDIEIHILDTKGRELIPEAEDIISSYTDIEKKIALSSSYVSIDGNNICCMIPEQPELLRGLLKGRNPIYDNELMITKMAAEAFGLKMGDEVTVSHNGCSAEYIITGLYQSTTDAGISCVIPSEGGKKLDINPSHLYAYYLKDIDSEAEIVRKINNKYGDSMNADFIEYGRGAMWGEYDIITLTIEFIIFVFSILFVLITMIMICSRTFLQERHDIGVYKALGFTTQMLRMQFSIRFFLVSMVGGLLGAVFSLLFTEDFLSLVFGIMGVVKVTPVFTAGSFILAISFVSVSVLIFAYLISGKIKMVSIRELITE